MGGFIFSNKMILNSTLLSENEEYSEFSEELQSQYTTKSETGFLGFAGIINQLIHRFSSGIGLFYLGFIFFLILAYIFRFTIGALIAKIIEALFKFLGCFCGCFFKILCCCCRKSEAQLKKIAQAQLELKRSLGIEAFSEDILTDFRLGPLADKFLKSQLELRSFRQLKTKSSD